MLPRIETLLMSKHSSLLLFGSIYIILCVMFFIEILFCFIGYLSEDYFIMFESLFGDINSFIIQPSIDPALVLPVIILRIFLSTLAVVGVTFIYLRLRNILNKHRYTNCQKVIDSSDCNAIISFYSFGLLGLNTIYKDYDKDCDIYKNTEDTPTRIDKFTYTHNLNKKILNRVFSVIFCTTYFFFAITMFHYYIYSEGNKYVYNKLLVAAEFPKENNWVIARNKGNSILRELSHLEDNTVVSFLVKENKFVRTSTKSYNILNFDVNKIKDKVESR